LCCPWDGRIRRQLAALKDATIPKRHPLDELAATGDRIAMDNGIPRASPSIAPEPSLPTQDEPLAEVDVYVDDFIAVAQGSHQRLRDVRSTLLHAIDAVFRPNDELDDKAPSARRHFLGVILKLPYNIFSLK
jgi:hypothetical protein